jgi:hypothetical protein
MKKTATANVRRVQSTLDQEEVRSRGAFFILECRVSFGMRPEVIRPRSRIIVRETPIAKMKKKNFKKQKCQKEEGRRKKEEGRRTKEEGGRKKEEGRRKKEEGKGRWTGRQEEEREEEVLTDEEDHWSHRPRSKVSWIGNSSNGDSRSYIQSISLCPK